MIDHISLPVSDVERAKAFYNAALAPLGMRRVMEVDEEDYIAVGYGPDEAEPLFSVGCAKQGETLIAQQPGFHVAFHADSRAAVDAFYRAALAAGGTDNGAPGIRPHYHPNYYGAFVFDPDGYHLEAVCHRPE